MILEGWKRFALNRQREQIQIPSSTRLLRRFGVRFLARPERRLYLRAGEHCLLNGSVTFESSDGFVQIGDRTYIGADTHIISRARVTIGDDVTMAWGITIYDHNSHSFDWRQRQRVVAHFQRNYGSPGCFDAIDWTGVGRAPLVIEDQVWFGVGAVILKGVSIGEGAVVGACSVVTRDVEPYTVVGGNPAQPLRRLAPVSEAERDPHAAG
jgi:galactoside O-acetyltransferase